MMDLPYIVKVKDRGNLLQTVLSCSTILQPWSDWWNVNCQCYLQKIMEIWRECAHIISFCDSLHWSYGQSNRLQAWKQIVQAISF